MCDSGTKRAYDFIELFMCTMTEKFILTLRAGIKHVCPVDVGGDRAYGGPRWPQIQSRQKNGPIHRITTESHRSMLSISNIRVCQVRILIGDTSAPSITERALTLLGPFAFLQVEH